MLTLILVCVFTALVFYLLTTKQDGYPPGPFRIPILGNLLQIFVAGSIVSFCEQNRKHFGNVSKNKELKTL